MYIYYYESRGNIYTRARRRRRTARPSRPVNLWRARRGALRDIIRSSRLHQSYSVIVAAHTYEGLQDAATSCCVGPPVLDGGGAPGGAGFFMSDTCAPSGRDAGP